MKHLIIKRTSSIMTGVYGMLLDEHGAPLCLTAERPWMDNQSNISCIPQGDYQVVPHVSNHFGECLKLEGTHPRTRILIHKGNNPMTDSRGCILVGMKVGWYKNNHSVLNSKEAFDKLMDYVGGERFTLTIKEC